jgi:hypothetical protein
MATFLIMSHCGTVENALLRNLIVDDRFEPRVERSLAQARSSASPGSASGA